MSQSTLSTIAQTRVARVTVYAKDRFGAIGYKEDAEIAPEVGWRPTLQLRPSPSLLIAFEYSEILYPDIIGVATADLQSFGTPTKVFQICPLSIYQSDKGQSRTNRLRARGIGLITVDDESGRVDLQFNAIPVTQNISENELKTAWSGLPPRVRRLFINAYETYKTQEQQGLQQASQVVEAVIRAMHTAAAKKAWVAAKRANADAAGLVEDLFLAPQCQNYRAVLGGLRSFLQTYRNVSSHPPQTAPAALRRITVCRAGFLEAARLTSEALAAAKNLGLSISFKFA